MSIFDIPAITKDMASKRNKWSVVKLKQENEKLKEELATLKRRLEAENQRLRDELEAIKQAVRFLEGCSYDTIFSLCDDIMTGGVANDEEKAHAATLLKVLDE